jgi:hypothetical protein
MSVGLGGGYGSSSSSQKGTQGPKWLQGVLAGLKPKVEGMIGQFDPSGGPNAAASSAYLGDAVAGKFGDPATDPKLAGVLDTRKATFMEGLDSLMQRISQSAGDNLHSSGAAVARGTAGRGALQDYDARTSELLLNERNRGQALQAAAVPQIRQDTVTPLNMMTALLNSLYGSTQKQSGNTSSWNVSGNVGASI